MTEKNKNLILLKFYTLHTRRKRSHFYIISHLQNTHIKNIIITLPYSALSWSLTATEKKWVSMNINVVNNNIQNLSSYQKLLHWLGIYEQWKMTEVPWWWIDLNTKSHGQVPRTKAGMKSWRRKYSPRQKLWEENVQALDAVISGIVMVDRR